MAVLVAAIVVCRFRRGQEHPQISPLLQVMPWPVYQDLSDRDLQAIYEYLRAIPHAEPAPATTTATGS